MVSLFHDMMHKEIEVHVDYIFAKSRQDNLKKEKLNLKVFTELSLSFRLNGSVSGLCQSRKKRRPEEVQKKDLHEKSSDPTSSK